MRRARGRRGRRARRRPNRPCRERTERNRCIQNCRQKPRDAACASARSRGPNDARVREPVVQREAIGAHHAGQKAGAERKRRNQIRQRAKRRAADRNRPVFLCDDFDAERHLPDGLPAHRRKGDEIAAVQEQKERGERQRAATAKISAVVKAAQPQREIQHDHGIERGQERRIHERRHDAARWRRQRLARCAGRTPRPERRAQSCESGRISNSVVGRCRRLWRRVVRARGTSASRGAHPSGARGRDGAVISGASSDRAPAEAPMRRAEAAAADSSDGGKSGRSVGASDARARR